VSEPLMFFWDSTSVSQTFQGSFDLFSFQRFLSPFH
jgi:hypothetical protein